MKFKEKIKKDATKNKKFINYQSYNRGCLVVTKKSLFTFYLFLSNLEVF